MRLTLLVTTMEEALRWKYHQNFPKDRYDLYKHLQLNHIKTKIDELKKKKVLKEDQYNLLFPPNQHQTDSTKFDVTLLALQLRTIIKLPHGKKWNKWPDVSDQTEATHLIRITETRNKIQHLQEVSQIEFDHIFRNISTSLVAFGCKKLDIEEIKTRKLQKYTLSYMEFIGAFLVFLIFAIYFRKVDKTELPSSKSFDVKNPNPSFFGRESEVEAIHLTLSSADYQHNGVVLYGMSGVGKSQIAKRYCEKYGNHYSQNIAWIHSSTMLSIDRNMKKFAELLGIYIKNDNLFQAKEKVYAKFAKTNLLLIFDDVADYKILFLSYQMHSKRKALRC